MTGATALGMTQAPVQPVGSLEQTSEVRASVSAVPREYLDPPAAWNPTVGLFLGGYGLALITIAKKMPRPMPHSSSS